MAKDLMSSYIKKMESNRKKAINGIFKPAKSNDVGKQVSNYETRLNNVGQDTDTRNPIEKFLNLKKDQNFLFDIAELLGRPQQALFGAIDSAQNGENALEGAKEGITGNKNTSGGQLLRNAGMKDSGEDKIGLDDVLGFGLDVFADPTNIAFGVGSASKIAKGSKLVSGADVISDAGKVLGKLDDAGRIVNEAGKTVGILDKAKGIVQPLKKDLTQRTFEAAGKYVVKPAAKAADLGVSKALEGLDAIHGIKYSNSGAKLAQDLGKVLPDGIKEGTNLKGALEIYKEAKSGISDVFNFAKSIPSSVWDRTKASEGKIRKAQMEATSIGKGVEKTINDFAKAKGIDVGTLNRQLALVTEDNLENSFNIKHLIDNFDNKVENNIVRVTNEQKPLLKQVLETLKENKMLNFKELKNGDFKITSVSTKTIKRDPSVMNKLGNINLTKRIDLSSEDAKLLTEALNNEELMKLYTSEIEPSYRQVSKIFKDNTDGLVDFDPIAARKGYLRRTVNQDALQASEMDSFYKGNKANTRKAAAMRKYENQAATNARKIELPGETIKSIENSIDRKYNQLSSNKIENLLDRQASIENGIENVKEKLSKRLEKLDNKSAKILKDTATKEQLRIMTLNELNRKNLKGYSKIATEEQIGSLMKFSFQSEKYGKEVDSILKQLEAGNLSNKKIKSLMNKLDISNKRLLKAEDDTYKLLNALDEQRTVLGLKSIKRTVNAFDNSNYLTAAITKNNIKLGEIQKARELIESNAKEIIVNKNKEINYLSSMIDNVDPTKDALILNQIERMKQNINVLKSAEGKELFKINYTESLFDFIDNFATKQANGMLLMNDVLFDTAMTDPSLIRAAKIGEKAPAGYKIMKSDSIISEMENWGDLFKPDSVKNFIENFKGSDIIIDKRLANMIEPMITPTTSNTVLNVFDSLNNTFKKYKTLSPGFQLRNVSGGWVNMTLAGIPADIATPFNKNQLKSLRILNNAQDLIDKSARGLLKGKEIKDYELLSKFIEAGFLNSTSKLYDIEEILSKSSKNAVGKSINELAKINNNINQYIDNMYKMTLMEYFEKNQVALAKSGFNNPIEAVKGILFSPNASDLSPFERKWMKRIVPFYTFTKQNLMFQFKNSIKNPAKYKQLIKAANVIYDGVFDSDEEYAKWQKEGFLLPLPFKDENGNNIVLKTNLPLSDLGEYISNPITRLASATAPAIKAPFEIATGKDVFTGADISKNPIDLLGKYTGLDLFMNQPKKIQKLGEEGTVLQKISTALPSIASYNDREKNVTYNQYDQLEKYQKMVSDLKNQGVKVPTITEIKKSNSSISKAKLITNNLKKYRKRKTTSN